MRTSASTLPDALAASASDGHGVLVFHLDDGEVRLTTGELAERALARAQHLARLGIGPGDRVALLGPNHPLWAEWAFAVWLAGGVLAPVAHPMRIRTPEPVAEHVRGVVASTRSSLLIGDPALLPASVGRPTLAWDEPVPSARASLPSVGPDDLAVIQSTSGSTGAPKGVMQTHGAVIAERNATKAALRIDHTDVVVGWLPFFFGGGLCSFLLFPVVSGLEAHVMPTSRFARDPSEWFRIIGRVSGTVLATPPTALEAAIRAAHRDPSDIDLSSVRVSCMGAEGVDPALVDTVLERGSALGLRPEAAVITYGLEEAVCLATATTVGAGARSDTIDLDELTDASRAVPATGGIAKPVVSCGSPVGGLTVKINTPDGAAAERVVGEVFLRGPSLMRGYVGVPASETFVDGWMPTGDIGYLVDGELYITGRAKDIVIVYGRNYHPEDFEWAAGRVPGVRPGRSVAFTHPEREGTVTLLVEPDPHADPDALPVAVRNAVADAVGVVPTTVVVVERGTVAMTDSGKLRRSTMRDAFLRGELTALATGRAGR